MGNYQGNYHSNPFSPEYVVESMKINDLTFQSSIKAHTVTAGEVTATKVALDSTGITGKPVVIAVIYRSGVALPTNFTLSYESGVMYVKGNANYTLTAGDIITYMVAQAS